MADKTFQFWGGNWEAFNTRTSGEMILSGPAGTGKTLANLVHLLDYGRRHPNARMLIVRKTRVSLTESALVTWENDVLGADHPLVRKPINRGNRTQYKFFNGSTLVTGGMDRPDKLLSTQFDLIYVPEATDLTLTDWETLGGRLRNGAGPYQLIFGDVNPTTPSHWIYKRYLAGTLKLIPTVHKDNPRYWDHKAGRWTLAGEEYVNGTLARMTGSRRKRFLEGLWEAAEGLVYDFRPEAHLLPVGWEPPADWPRGWSIDWGTTDPTVIQFWATDPQKRMHLYREIYASRTRVESLAKRCATLVASGEEPLPAWVVADHDPENITTFRTYGKGKTKAGREFELPCVACDKRDRDGGIERVAGLFEMQADGRPAIYFRPDARRDPPCPHLESAGRKVSTLEELTNYVWDIKDADRKQKNEPIDYDDHGMDAMRYAVIQVHTPRVPFVLPNW